MVGRKRNHFGCLLFFCFGVVLVQVRNRRKESYFEVQGITVRKFFNLLSCLLGNYPNLFLIYVCVRKTLTLPNVFLGWFELGYMVFLSLFCFGWKFSVKKGKNGSFLFLA